MDWKLALVKNYKKMDLTENELAMIFVVDSLLQDGQTFITPDMLSLQMTLPFEQIDSCFTTLLKRCYLSYDKNMKLSLDNLISLISAKYPAEISIEEEKDENDEVIHLFENEFARALSETEVTTINEWIKNGNTIEKIKEALNNAMEKYKNSK